MALNLKAFLGLDGSGFQKGLNQATQASEKFSAGFQKIFNAGSGGLSGVISSFGGRMAGALGFTYVFKKIEEGISRLQDRAKEIRAGGGALGLNTNEFQRIQNVMEGTGSGVEKVTHAFVELAKAQDEVKNNEEGAAKTIKLFASLGVSLDEIKTKSIPQLFFEIAENMKSAAMDGEKLAAMAKVFGNRNLYAVVPAIKKGFTGALANSDIIDEDLIEKLKKQGEAQKELMMPFKLFWQGVIETAGDAKAGLIGMINKADKYGYFKDTSNPNAEKRISDAKIEKAKKEAEKEANEIEAEKIRKKARVSGEKLSGKLEDFADAKNKEGWDQWERTHGPMKFQLSEMQRIGSTLGMGRITMPSGSNPYANPKDNIEAKQLNELQKMVMEQIKVTAEIRKLTGG